MIRPVTFRRARMGQNITEVLFYVCTFKERTEKDTVEKWNILVPLKRVEHQGEQNGIKHLIPFC